MESIPDGRHEDVNVLGIGIVTEPNKQGIVEVRIEFNGSDDEGQIEEITCIHATGGEAALDWPCEISGKVIKAGSVHWEAERGQHGPVAAIPLMTMREVLDE